MERRYSNIFDIHSYRRDTLQQGTWRVLAVLLSKMVALVAATAFTWHLKRVFSRMQLWLLQHLGILFRRYVFLEYVSENEKLLFPH